MRTGSYDKFPVVEIPDGGEQAWRGWPEICCKLFSAIDAASSPCWPSSAIRAFSRKRLAKHSERRRPDIKLIDMRDALLSEKEIAQLIAPFSGGDDPIFGFTSDLSLRSFFQSHQLEEIREQASSASVAACPPRPGCVPRSARPCALCLRRSSSLGDTTKTASRADRQPRQQRHVGHGAAAI